MNTQIFCAFPIFKNSFYDTFFHYLIEGHSFLFASSLADPYNFDADPDPVPIRPLKKPNPDPDPALCKIL
jgi:hypothetical protein